MIRTLLALLLTSILLTTGCSPKDEIYTGYFPQSKIVLHSYICADSVIRLEVGRTRAIGDVESGYTLKNATAQLLINDQPAGEFSYQSDKIMLSTITAKPGDRVTIQAQAPGYKSVWGTTKVPADTLPVRIDTLAVGDDLEYSIRIPANNQLCYYRLIPESHYEVYENNVLVGKSSFLHNINYEKEPILMNGYENSSNGNNPNYFRIFSNKLFTGHEYILRFRAKRIWNTDFTYQQDGKTIRRITISKIRIKLLELTPENYHYLNSLSAEYIDEGQEPTSIFTNVHSGVGVIGGFSESSAWFDSQWTKEE